MKHALAFLATICGLAAFGDLQPSFAGRVDVTGPVDAVFEPSAALAPWQMMLASGMSERADGTRDFAFSAPDSPGIAGTFRSTPAEDGSSVMLDWTFKCEKDLRLLVLGLMTNLRLKDYGGGWIEADGVRHRLPTRGRPQDIGVERIRKLSMDGPSGGRRLDFVFEEPVNLFIQYWGGNAMSFRLLLTPDDKKAKRYAGGVARRLAFSLSGAGKLVANRMTPMTLKASDDWIALKSHSEIIPDSALDFSKVVGIEKPAGCRGRVVARGSHFEFENLPGVNQRFYGVNLCGLANYPESLEDARRMVLNLTRVGYNAVRIHHHDGYCVDKTDPSLTRLDEAMMRRMDALVAACSENGVYITTDLFVSRTRLPLAWKACGVDRPGNVSMRDFKYSAPVHEGVYSNFLAFAGNWLNHRNIHTGRRYAQEPALAWLSLVNEGNIDEVSGDCASLPGWREAWKKWLAERKASEPAIYANIPDTIPNGVARNLHGRAFLRFLQEVEFRFARRTTEFVRSCGCQALLTDMNNGCLLSAAFGWPRSEAYDYVDSHFYVDHPRFLKKAWRLPSWCPNANPFLSENAGVCAVAASRLLNRPFTITEYNFSGPGRFRGVGGIATGALAALQDWSGMWRFAWSHNLEAAMQPGTRGIGYFDIASDPLQLASERASICLFRRGDIEPLKRGYAITLPNDAVADPRKMIGESLKVDWLWAAWHAKVGAIFGDRIPAEAIPAGEFSIACAKGRSAVAKDIFGTEQEPEKAGDGHLKIDRQTGSFTLSTGRTSGGFAERGSIVAENFKAEIAGSAATVWVSSLDGRDIADSHRMIVTHLTDVQNSGARYADSSRTVIEQLGCLPYLVRNGEANVSIRNSGSKATVYALETSGARRYIVESACNDGWISFACKVAKDAKQATFLYEIVIE